MTLNFTAQDIDEQLKPRITVVGVGGAGGNAVNNMIVKQLEGVDFVVANTDAQAIAQSHAERRIQLGRTITHGLGAGARPDMGRAAAEEAIEDIAQFLAGSHMVFIAAGMGGGTGTGAAPVIARLAREQGMLTVGVVTKPFQFEGSNRMRLADAGIEEMQQFVDTLIVIPNQNLFRIANEKTTFADAFAMADDVLHSGVRGVTDLMVVPGLINLDFADIRSVMSEMGKAMMGTGEAEGDDRARLAAEAAISNPLLDDVSMKGARGVLINITGGPDMTLFEVDEAANRIGEEVDADANIIFGSALDASLEGRIRVSVVATGIDIEANAQPRTVLRVLEDPLPLRQVLPSRPSFGGLGPQFGAAVPATNHQPLPANEEVEIAAPSQPEARQTDSLSAGSMQNDDLETQETVSPLVEYPVPNSTEDSFIPPPPVEPIRSSPEQLATDPSREAEIPDNAAPMERKKIPNLFQRMTGNSWSRKTDREEPNLVERNQRTAPNTLACEPQRTPEPSPAAGPPVQAPPSVEPIAQQPRLTSLDAQNRLPTSQGEEDLLDIPAFLRRQAN
ncbi:MAG: cell division protein FtsZ [Proteobacteria bacterium]|nr:cell division protein FtsZ [Pseudomonadota bacterium]